MAVTALMYLEVWLLALVAVGAVAAVLAQTVAILGVDQLRTEAGADRWGGLAEGEVLDCLTALARRLDASAVSTARTIVGDAVADRWLVELARQRLEGLTVPAATAKRRVRSAASIGSWCVALLAVVAGALTEHRLWAVATVVAAAAAIGLHVADRSRSLGGARLLAAIALHQPLSPELVDLPAAVVSPCCCDHDESRLRQTRAWCLSHLASLTVLTSAGVVA